MKIIGKALLLFFLIVSYAQSSIAQIYGPELIPQGNFGTIASEGKNGDNNIGTSIYPDITGGTTGIPVYYQPVQRAYHNGALIYISINPGVTVGYPLTGKTSYRWGMNEPWISDTYSFPKNDESNSNVNIPHAPNNGNYLVVTGTKGMYNLPSLNAHAWAEIVDRYEVDADNPTNYFLVTNADQDANKIFYKERVKIVPGQAYRMSVDIARLNSGGDTPPNVAFVINDNEASLPSAAFVHQTGNISQANAGKWINYHFDYVAPCSSNDSTYVAFRNRQAGGGGNDVGLDNLSMKAIIPQVDVKLNDCGEIIFAMLNDAIVGSFDPSIYHFQWQKIVGGTFQDISGATDIEVPISEVGTYRLSIYTTATAACPMYSNEVLVVMSGGCLEVAKPVAVDDHYTVVLSSVKTGNVLDNDFTSDPVNIPHSNLGVTTFTIGNNTYPAGSTALVYNTDGTTKIGVITINNNGNFDLQLSSDFSGVVPPIKYAITQEGAGRDTALIYFTRVTSYSFVLDASCISCPINIWLISPNVDPAHSYYVYKGDSLMSVGTVSNDSIIFSFRETTSGFNNYTFRINDEKIITVAILISPDKATWSPNLIYGSTDWELSENWKSETGMGFPQWCTDVVIPDSATYYPILKDDAPLSSWCRDITFKNGANIGKVHNLNYRRAFVELTPDREEWKMLSAPLKYMYSADYSADPTWGPNAGVDPKIYMRYFDVKFDADTTVSIPNPDGTKGTSIGSFSVAFKDLKEKLDLGRGFVLKIDQGSNDAFNGTYKFPRLNADSTEVLFKYHYRSTGNWVETSSNPDNMPFRFTDSGQEGRGTQAAPTNEEWLNKYLNFEDQNIRGIDNRYRFIYETGSNEAKTFTVTVPNAGTTNIVGNPYMSYIDFEKFYNTNPGKIQSYYRVWDGTSFYSYMIGGGVDNGTWRGLPPVGTVVQAQREIAPMQAFFVEMTSGNNELTFNSDSISVSSINRLRTRASSDVDYLLNLQVKMGDDVNEAIVATLPLATDEYDAKEDVYKLFSYDTSIPEVYTISDGQAIEINAVSSEGTEKVIPIGVKTDKTGNVSISIKNITEFSTYPYVFLKDAQDSGKMYDMRKNSSVNFEKTASVNSEGRFYLVLSQSNTSSIGEEGVDSSINVFTNDSRITVSSPLSEIKSIEMYDMSGRLQYRADDVNSMYYNFDSGLAQGVFILKVNTMSKQESFKINI